MSQAAVCARMRGAVLREPAVRLLSGDCHQGCFLLLSLISSKIYRKESKFKAEQPLIASLISGSGAKVPADVRPGGR